MNNMDKTNEFAIALMEKSLRHKMSGKPINFISNGVTLQDHDCHWATEAAYKNGYEAGKRDAYKWKATVDSVPKEFVSVLIYIPSEYPLPMVKEAYLVDGLWVTKTSMFFAKDVTHWCEMPEPPKGE